MRTKLDGDIFDTAASPQLAFEALVAENLHHGPYICQRKMRLGAINQPRLSRRP
jgi:hypothetical protein